VDNPAGSGRRGSAAPIDGSFCTEPQATTLTMDRRDNARTEELNNLRLALAAFDLQLAAFEMRLQLTAVEMRMDRAPLRGGPKPGIPAARPDTGRRLQKENERWSIRSLGKKPDM
jgi:hypothetical protein